MHAAFDQERYLRLWTGAQPAVTGYIHAVVRDPAAAKDVLQETALVLFRRFAEYDEARPFVAWALGVARLQVLGFLRDRARERERWVFDEELLDGFTAHWAEGASVMDTRAGALQECLRQLPPRAREVVRQRYFEELSAEEIARRAGGNGASLRVMLQRVREQLRACIERRMQMEGGAA